jgi:hypothetical protein
MVKDSSKFHNQLTSHSVNLCWYESNLLLVHLPGICRIFHLAGTTLFIFKHSFTLILSKLFQLNYMFPLHTYNLVF